MLLTGFLVGRGKKVKFRGIFRVKFAEKTADFAGNSRDFRGQFRGKMIGEEWPISWEVLEQISLESDWFCVDFRNVFNETRRIYSGFIPYFTSKLIEHQIKESGY